MTNVFSTFINCFKYDGADDILIKNITGFSQSDTITLIISGNIIFSGTDATVAQFGIMKGPMELHTLSNNKKTIYYSQFIPNEVNKTIIPHGYNVYTYSTKALSLIEPKIISHFFVDACFIGFTEDCNLIIICGETSISKLSEVITSHNITKIKIYGYTKLLHHLRANSNIISIHYINE
jgi:hypothetical protein